MLRSNVGTLPLAPPRVVQVLPLDGIGGVEAAARAALEPTPDMDFVIAPMAGPTFAGTPPERVLAARYYSPNDPRAIFDTVKRVLRFQPDVVIGSLWRSGLVLLALRLIRPRLRLVYFLHVENVQHLPDHILSATAMAVADEIWCDSKATQQRRLTTRQRARSRVISFVTNRLSAPATVAAGPSFTIWARLSRQKGIDRGISLIDALAARGVPATYAVYGPDGGDRAALERQVRQIGLDRQVCFLGPIAAADRPRAAGTTTFFLQLSRFEGMAMGVVEAMQLGLIPVVTAVGEIANYVVDGENGLIVDTDALDAAADRLAVLLQDKAELARLRNAAIQTWQRAALHREAVAGAVHALVTHRI